MCKNRAKTNGTLVKEKGSKQKPSEAEHKQNSKHALPQKTLKTKSTNQKQHTQSPKSKTQIQQKISSMRICLWYDLYYKL